MIEKGVRLREAMLVAAEKKSAREAAASLGVSLTTFYRYLREDEKIWDQYISRKGIKTRKGRNMLTYAQHKERDRLHQGHHWGEQSEGWMKRVADELKKRRDNSKLVEKALAARAAGMTYGYYVALVVERRGRIIWQNAE